MASLRCTGAVCTVCTVCSTVHVHLLRAARDTILTTDMIKLSTYDELREQLGQEMGLDPAGTKPLSDQELLEQFYQCKFR